MEELYTAQQVSQILGLDGTGTQVLYMRRNGFWIQTDSGLIRVSPGTIGKQFSPRKIMRGAVPKSVKQAVA